MVRAIAEIEDEIRALAPEDKERLLTLLLEELDGPADSEAERAWLDEVQRRSRELDAGVVQPESADKVFARARSTLRR
ncbi:MAG: addiction module protein [Gammaproteobacteria bacterium]